MVKYVWSVKHNNNLSINATCFVAIPPVSYTDGTNMNYASNRFMD